MPVARAGWRLIIDIGIDLAHRTDHSSQPRMREAQYRNAFVTRIGSDGANAIDIGDTTLPVVVHDHRNLMAEIAPCPRQQHVLHGFAADVLRVLQVRQLRIIVEADNADLHLIQFQLFNSVTGTAPIQPYASARRGAATIGCSATTGSGTVSRAIIARRIVTPVYAQK